MCTLHDRSATGSHITHITPPPVLSLALLCSLIGCRSSLISFPVITHLTVQDYKLWTNLDNSHSILAKLLASENQGWNHAVWTWHKISQLSCTHSCHCLVTQKLLGWSYTLQEGGPPVAGFNISAKFIICCLFKKKQNLLYYVNKRNFIYSCWLLSAYCLSSPTFQNINQQGSHL